MTPTTPRKTTKSSLLLAHDVFFTLVDDSGDARARLVSACQKYLTGHDGTVFFSVGTLADGFARPVNDRDWDVALHIHFRDQAAHDRYQDAPRHQQFIEEQQGNWKSVRVFDSWVEALAASGATASSACSPAS